MPDLDPQVARERCEAATETNWEMVYRGEDDVEEAWQRGWWIGDKGSSWIHVSPDAREDAEFILHSFADLPAALEVLEEIRKVAEDAGCNLPHPSGLPCGDCGSCRTLAILGESE